MAGYGSNEPIVGGSEEPLPAPAPERRFSEQAVAELAEIVSHYPHPKAAMLPALWLAQREYGGHLTQEALREVAERLGRPFAEVEGVATFYTMYNIHPRGRHHLEVCTCLTCGCVGAYDVLRRLEELLGIHVGETTPDGEFTLSEVECLDWCGAGTVVQVGDRYYGYVTKENAGEIVRDLRGTDRHTPTALADSIVKLHLRGGRKTEAAPSTPGQPTGEDRAPGALDAPPPVAGDKPVR